MIGHHAGPCGSPHPAPGAPEDTGRVLKTQEDFPQGKERHSRWREQPRQMLRGHKQKKPQIWVTTGTQVAPLHRQQPSGALQSEVSSRTCCSVYSGAQGSRSIKKCSAAATFSFPRVTALMLPLQRRKKEIKIQGVKIFKSPFRELCNGQMCAAV